MGRQPMKPRPTPESLGLHPLRVLRRARGLSIEQLHELSGVTYKAISDIENRKTKPRIYTRKRLLEALGIAWTRNNSLEYFDQG